LALRCSDFDLVERFVDVERSRTFDLNAISNLVARSIDSSRVI
jgi:hypothetical protein